MKIGLLLRRRPRIGLRGNAFTILELMLALGIFAMVLTAIYATWIAILKGSRAGLKAAAEVQRARMTIRTLEDAFNGTEYFQANMKYYVFLADTSGDMAEVELAARLPASFPGIRGPGSDGQDVRRVRFFTEPGKDGMHDLMMSQWPITSVPDSANPPYTITLARDVTHFQLAFYEPQKGEWLDEWKYTNKLPRMVQIALGLGKSATGGNKPYEVVYSMIALPSIGVTADIQGGFRPGRTNMQQGIP